MAADKHLAASGRLMDALRAVRKVASDRFYLTHPCRSLRHFWRWLSRRAAAAEPRVSGPLEASIACGVFVAWVALLCLMGEEDSRRRRVRESVVERWTWAMHEFAAGFQALAVSMHAAMLSTAEATRRLQLAIGRGHNGHGGGSLASGGGRSVHRDSA